MAQPGLGLSRPFAARRRKGERTDVKGPRVRQGVRAGTIDPGGATSWAPPALVLSPGGHARAARIADFLQRARQLPWRENRSLARAPLAPPWRPARAAQA